MITPCLMEIRIEIFLLPASIVFSMLVVAVCFFAVMFGVKRAWKKSFREPFSGGILRPPGWGCLERREDALMNAFGLTMVVTVLWGGWVYVLFRGHKEDLWGLLIVLFALTIYSIIRVRKDVLRARTERLGFLGECLVAEMLEPLAADGWRVFHDVPMENEGKHFNIDHVIVGAEGVFAVETKTWSRLRRKIQGDWKVTVDGDTVLLPGGRSRTPLKQAKRQAACLRDFLNTEGVEISFVNPLVALAGWQVSLKKDGNPTICDAANIAGLLRKCEKRLQAREVERIVKVLDGKCRVLRFSEEEENRK